VAAIRHAAARRRGVTLIEMVIVVSLLALLAGIMYPSVASGLDSLRLSSAAESIASFLNAGMNHAERRRVPVMVEVVKSENALYLRSTEAGWVRKLEMPDGVLVHDVQPVPPAPPEEEHALVRYMLYPGVTPPRIAVTVANLRGAKRIVRVDPVTGVSEIQRTVEP
jgi:prepilin-type N-terminal cleavage/methylation domain-containing protein